MKIRHQAAFAVMICVCIGCGKVEEITKSATDSVKDAAQATQEKLSAPTPSSPSSSATAKTEPAPKPAKVDPDAVLNQFFARPSAEVQDQHLDALASLDAAHREQVLKLDLSGSAVQVEGIKALKQFPNLNELILDRMSLPAAGYAALAELNQLHSLSLHSHGDAVTPVVLESLAGWPNLERLTVAWCNIGDPHLKALAQFQSLKHLDATRCVGPISAGLSALAKLNNLQSLNLSASADVPDFEQGLLALTQSKGLRALDLNGCNITDGHLSVFRNWSKITKLNLGATGVGDQGMAFLKPLDLVELDLFNTKVSDVSLTQLNGRQLQKLNLQKTSISDQGTQVLKRFTKLKDLDLSSTGVGDLGMTQLKSLKDLESLGLGATQVTDRGLSELTSLSNLKRINLTMTQVTDAGIAALRKTLPDLVVDDGAR